MEKDLNRSSKGMPETLGLEEHGVIGLVFYWLLFLIGTVVNVTALWVFILSTRKKTSITIYMINVAIVDLLFIFFLPFRLVYYIKHSWPFGDVICQISAAVTVFYPSMALWLFALISTDRFVALTQSRQCNALKNVSKATLSCVGIWIMTLGISSPLLFINGDPDKASNFTTCVKIFNVAHLRRDNAVNFIRLVFYFLVPVCIMIGCYIVILNKLTYGRAAQLKSKVKKKSVWIVVTLLIQLLICFLPYHVCFVIQLLKPQADNPRSWCASTRFLMNFSTVLDTFLFYIVSKQFKERVVSVVLYRNYMRSQRRKFCHTDRVSVG